MNPKKVLIGDEGLEKICAGAQILADAVTATLGPKSRNVGVDQNFPGPRIIHDGVSVARAIALKDPFENMGVQYLRLAAAQTNDIAGDGTTTATLLGNTLLQNGKKYITGTGQETFASKVNPMTLRDNLLSFSDIILERLTKMAKPIEKPEEIEQVASISASSKEVGKMVSDAVQKVGKDGLIMVEPSQSFESSVEYVEGMEFDNGFLSALFMTDPYRGIAEYEDGYVLLTDHTISDPSDITPIIELVRKDDNKPLMIIANDIVGPALRTMVLSVAKAQYKLIGVIAPEYGDMRREVLEDIATLTGATVIPKETRDLKDVEIKDLGRVRNMRSTFTHTAITPKYPDAEELKDRIALVKKQLDSEKNDFRQRRLQLRLSRLAQGVAIISVGGGSATEIDEKRERFIDAVYATKAAMAEGVLPGGGIALYSILKDGLEDKDVKKYLPESVELIGQMLRAPFETLIKNSGLDLKQMEFLLDAAPSTLKYPGIDVTDGSCKDMIAHGILDPVKVTKSAVKHAISIAASILTTAVFITDDVSDKPEKMILVNANG